jgi:hypothetical protein
MRTHVWQEEQKRKERYTKASITESLVLDIPSFTSFWFNLFLVRLNPCLPGHNERGTRVFAPGTCAYGLFEQILRVWDLGIH